MKYIKRKSIIKPLSGTISDTLHIENKTINTYSANVIDNLTAIETITNSNGTAIKYPDGTLICKHFLDLGTGLAITRAYGSVFITADTYSWTFPMEFKEIPIDIQVTGFLSGGIGGATLSSLPTTKGIQSMYMWHAQSYTFTGKTSGIYLSATGRWK